MNSCSFEVGVSEEYEREVIVFYVSFKDVINCKYCTLSVVDNQMTTLVWWNGRREK